MIKEAFNYFQKIYLINLDSRPDRLARALTIFNQLGIADRVERLSGIVPPDGNGRQGCLLSHIETIKRAKALGLKNVLVFEDDFELMNINFIPPAIDQLQRTHWALYYLGYNSHSSLSQVSPNLLKITNCYAAHAIAYNSTIFDFILHAFENNNIEIIDVWLAKNVQSKFECFGSYPLAAIQIPGHSDIEKKEVNYDFIIDRFIKNTKHLTKKNDK
jgi:hypothetical protein